MARRILHNVSCDGKQATVKLIKSLDFSAFSIKIGGILSIYKKYNVQDVH